MATKVLFVHDGPLYQNKSGDFFGIHYNDKIKARYLMLGDELTFCMRLRTIEDGNSSKFSPISSDHFRFIEFPNFKSIRNYFPNKAKAVKTIEEAVASHDVVVARMPSASGTIAVKAARKLGKPYLVEFVACTFDAYWNYNWKGKMIAHYKLREQQQIIKDCPYVIYVTKEFLQNRYPTTGKSINCSNVELKDLSEEKLNKRLEKIAAGVPETMSLATVAAIDVPYKGQDDVIKAISILKKQGVTVKYHVIGQGKPDYLKSIAEKHGVTNQVEIIGALPHEQVFEFLEKIDLYIQPSKQEGLPRALIEAMSVGCPALGARTAGIPELLSPEKIFRPGDAGQIASLIKNFGQQEMKAEAQKNFTTAKEYQKDILFNRRKDFYNLFLKEAVHANAAKP
ncbi:glycosyltransferase family 4 protein [Flavobacterium pallidum]|uniref:Glycosyl transferase n=1 Tax=Flavobacterium pallidum TaxID=2172098 RepID=A0A2S1SDH2_9FLAO|nr:glycosyltransferase [Flavobacterium pallidum]AWI24446.1 glycosyl transferase [Flavobacterium pallidum]